MVEAIHEVAVYLHRFHNLDLFEQGKYQIKISMRWEDSEFTSSPGSPSRVVQYKASELGYNDILGSWRIDDIDNSFLSQPFRIRYARQDIFLCVMISFNLSLGKYKGPITSPIILKFELLFASIIATRSNLQVSWDAGPAAVHEFRIPPMALLGLHTYCPVYFDAFHSVLVDTSVHISLLKGCSCSMKTPSHPHGHEETADVKYNKAIQVIFVKAFLTSHAILLEELKNLSKIFDQTIDLTGLDEKKLLPSSIPATAEPSEVPDKTRNDLKERNSIIGYHTDYLYSLQTDELSRLLDFLGDQILYLWKTYLNCHSYFLVFLYLICYFLLRDNKERILEQLHDVWNNDRRTEWSIWIISSKVETHRYYDSNNGLLGQVHARQRITHDPAEAAAKRAELHRCSIAQMKMNSRSIQDLQVFGDPSHAPIIIIERVVIASLRSARGDSYLRSMDVKDTDGALPNIGLPLTGNQENGRVLKIVVFVHGFLGHHLDLRLMRNQWLLMDPKMEFLMSEVNEENTTGDFSDMGLRLAKEVVCFIEKKMDKASRYGTLKDVKLSFVGHSIGNVIIRSALAESTMEPYHRFLHTYVSLSGPHLGYLYSSNSLFNSGVWLLKKLKNTPCIHQLTFSDDYDLENTFFYKLCKKKTLESFKNIILLSSPQDGYVPYHSARIEMCQASSQDYSKRGQVFLEMLKNCLEQIHAPSSEQRTFMRCDVNFDVSLQGRNLNTIIGRAAHIEFLETNTFVKFIMWSFPEFFC
uniref:uncharacterized protein LOC122604412 n=1 Tax=Erigeron canadensis TaxID=72917 RepID=UPI001CB8F88B|nr:uncharacterized protein LOC122604412 [Erigeron canadensis]